MRNGPRGIYRACGLLAYLVALCWSQVALADIDSRTLDVGVAGHAFDHLGNLGDQAPAAAACGSNILYTTGFGWMYEGMRPPKEMTQAEEQVANYVLDARSKGIRLVFGYVCATSIAGLRQFDRNWPPELRAQFSSGPAAWLQQDSDGKPLPSWYGGEYRPACMNNPDWRAYEKYVVRLQLEAGMDGIFLDNPTVHPQGCYCEHCMKKFAAFLEARGIKTDFGRGATIAPLRKLATGHPDDFRRFRATIAADFLADMRAYAQSVKPGALITCNNSLNSPDAYFRQCRTYGYNIWELSKVEDLVVVEDMVSQPRVLPNGATSEYGPAYEMLRAISHGKPLVAITLAEGDYHTPPDLTRLAMAEAAAHGASYLLWPTWPAAVRERMIAAVRPEADLLRRNSELLKNARGRADVVLLVPFGQWTATADCRAMQLAQALAAANVQFQAASEEDLANVLDRGKTKVLVVESRAVLASEKQVLERFESRGGKVLTADRPDWLTDLGREIEKPSAGVQAPSTIRLVLRDQPGRTVVHLLNLNVRRVSSFEDVVTPAQNVELIVRVPLARVRSVRAISADATATQGAIAYTASRKDGATRVKFRLPNVTLSTIVVVE